MEIRSLLDVLIKHCKVFGYSLTDDKHIDPSIITHKIIMQDGQRLGFLGLRLENSNISPETVMTSFIAATHVFSIGRHMHIFFTGGT
jgi:hypothetical protein